MYSKTISALIFIYLFIYLLIDLFIDFLFFLGGGGVGAYSRLGAY